jgi:hypothetical protein
MVTLLYRWGGIPEDFNDSANTSDTLTGEIFDPLNNKWRLISKPSPAFSYIAGDCNGSVLADGRVFLGAASLTAYPLRSHR